MRLYKHLVALFGFYITVTTAIPVFNTANDYDLSGHTCKLHTARDIPCPTLCVSNINNCPPEFAPNCPAGQTLCPDGACHASCQSIANVCDCGVTSQVLFPCHSSSLLVDIPNFNGTDREAMTANACNTKLAKTFPLMSADAKDNMWLSCPAAALPSFTYTEPMFVSIYAIVGAELLLIVAWHMYKTAAEKSVKSQLRASELKSSLNEKEMISHHESEELDFQGFTNNIFGTFVMTYAYTIGIGWLILLGIIVADYYGAVNGVAYGIFLTSDLSSKIFCAFWHVTTVWLIVLYLYSSSIRNYFRIQSLNEKGEYIQIKKKKDAVILLDDNSLLLRKLRQGEALFTRYFGGDYLISTSKVLLTDKKRRYFEFQCTRYVYNPEKDSFEPFVFYLAPTNEQLHKHSHGLTKEEAAYRLELLGPNFISVYVPSFFVAVIQEFGAYFYLYQMMCLWVWYYFNYYYMGLVQTVVIIISAIIKVILRLKSEHKVKSLAEFREDCSVLRDGKWVTVSSTDLVTGDVFEVQSGHCVPCDAVILSGEVIVNESSLTGEAMPVRKFPIKNDEGAYDAASSKSSTLFCGTTVLQVSPTSDDGKVKAIVAATGTATDKGNMVHKILFPSPVSFIFDEQLKIVVIILLLWGVVAFGLSLWLMGRGDIVSWFYGIFIISQIMSPLLPAALVVGQSVAAGRLRSKNIYCVDLPRIMIAGKVQIFCFDKTGTLTKEGLDYYGVSTVKDHDGSSHFEDREESVAKAPVDIQMGLATCHAVTQVNDQFIGNPVDIEMFRATKWNLIESNNVAYLDSLVPSYAPEVKPVHIIKRFEFVHARASMSVAVLDSSTGHVHIFIKGSFEKIKELSQPESIPHDFDTVTASYAREGCYVLALAHRDLGPIDIETVKKWSREQMESMATFAGLILFKNKLKDDTTAAIAELKGGDTRTVMITGDNALTGIYIARACGMMPTGGRVLLGDVGANSRLEWMDFDSSEYVNVDETLHNHPNQVELAVTAKAFDELVRNGDIRKYLLNIRVFARMTPDGKVQCVQLHMERSVVGMCGDGGNDCGALRAAHVGIALSEAEASIVSPFSTSVRSIYSCVELLKQGRTALATSFAVFKFLILYGETMAFLELMQYYFTVVVQQWIWVVIDGFVTVGLAWALTLSKPAAKLDSERPTARLLGPATLTSAISQVFVNLIFFIGAIGLLFRQQWFVCNEFDGASADAARWWLLADSYEAELIAIVCLYQFINAAAVFNFGYKFRQSWWRNYVLVIMYLGMMSFVSVLTLADPNRMSCFFRINCGTPNILVEEGYPKPTWYIESYNSAIGHNVMPHKFRWTLFIYCLVNCLVNILVEYFIVLGPLGTWIKNKYPSKARRNHIKFKL
ncbi:hypothetical protein K7432_011280 [Basidiobolus ranarum]|uniref:P-type ATPase A domain-containing protein n=1 Tax=Basidiobolus ranarum TaxID=34480 RepID=A0ABR2WML4_9FUNG